jgi:hypothetical protein
MEVGAGLLRRESRLVATRAPTLYIMAGGFQHRQFRFCDYESGRQAEERSSISHLA